MINIRLSGTPDEISQALKKLEGIFKIVFRSRYYQNSNKETVRLYCDVDLIQKEENRNVG